MKETKRISYMLRHSQHLIANAELFAGMPNDGEVISENALTLLEILATKRKGKRTEFDYKDQLSLCIGMMDANYDFIDFVSGGDVMINNKSGLNSRRNPKPRTKRPKKDTAACWVSTMIPNRLVLKTTRDETARVSAVISSTEKDFEVEVVGNSQLKITLGGKHCLLDFSTAAKIILHNLEGGAGYEAFLAKFNSNGLAPILKMPEIIPNIGHNYRPIVVPEKKDGQSFLATEPNE